MENIEIVIQTYSGDRSLSFKNPHCNAIEFLFLSYPLSVISFSMYKLRKKTTVLWSVSGSLKAQQHPLVLTVLEHKF